MVKVLVIGSGGREHAIVKSLIDDSEIDEVLCSPGNGGTSAIPGVRNISCKDHEELRWFAQETGVDLTVVGPEDPLAEGIVDLFQDLRIFGFNRATAQLEASKVFAKEFMRKYSIPTADFAVFDDFDRALDYLKPRLQRGETFFIKADELCGGKGALAAGSLGEARSALRFLLKEKGCGCGERVVIEQALEGEEVTIMVIIDPRGHFLLMPPSQDYKRAWDGGVGPNTGGLGAYAPTPLVTLNLQQKIIESIIEPTLQGLKEEGLGGAGVLYFGLMINTDGPHLLEYNVRFGDPEAQVVLPLLQSDLYTIFCAAIEGRLDEIEIEWADKIAVCVVISTKGYPLFYGHEREEIKGIAEAEALKDVNVYHAGTELKNGKFVTHGGRILAITGIASTMEEARRQAYQTVDKINFEGMRYRHDIAVQNDHEEV